MSKTKGKRGRFDITKLKKNAAGLYEFTAYYYRNKLTGLYYCGVTVHPGNRKSIWKCLKSEYAGKKINAARKKYGVGEDAWEFWDKTITAATVDDLIREMDYTEVYLIAFYNSYHNGYNSNAGGLGRGSKGQVSVSMPGYDTVIYDSCQAAAVALRMSPGTVYYYVHTSSTHQKKENGYIFTAVPSQTTSITTMP